MKGQSLSKKVVFISIAVTAGMLLIIFLAYLSHRNFERSVVSQTQQQLLATAKMTAGRLEEYIDEHSKALKILLANPSVQESLYKGVPHKTDDVGYCIVKAMYEIHKDDVDALATLDVHGIMLHRHPFVEDRPGRGHVNKPGVAYVKREHKPYVSPVFYNNLGNPAISISEPVFYRDEFAGIVRWMIQTDTIYKRFIEPIKVDGKTCKWIIDAGGILLAHEEQDKVGQHFIRGKKQVVRDYDWSGLENVVAQATLGEEGVGLFACPKRGRRIVAYAPIQAGNQLWSFGISVSYSEIEAPIIQHEWNILALSALIILLFGTAAVAVFRIRNRQ